MDSISQAQGDATNLSAPQKALATLLSIILVVGLSPVGKTPTRAWAIAYNAAAIGQMDDEPTGSLTAHITPAADSQTLAVDDAIEHGSISVTPTTGIVTSDTITVTATPDSGYVTSTVTYVQTGNQSAAPIAISEPNADGTYSFAMPGYDTTVSATFAKPSGTPEEGDNTIAVDVNGTTFYYAGLAEAIAALNAGSLGTNPTLKVCKATSTLHVGSAALAINRNCTIDLNGKELKVAPLDSTVTGLAGFDVNANVKVIGGVNESGKALESPGKITSTIAGAPLFDVNGAYKLSISDVKSISSSTTAIAAQAGAEVTSSGTGYTVDGSAAGAAISANASKLTVESGSVTRSANAGASAIAATGSSTLALGKEDVEGGPTVLAVAPSVAVNASTATIYGGSYNSTGASTATTGVAIDGASDVTVVDGTFNGDTGGISVAANANAKLNVKGGTFPTTTALVLGASSIDTANSSISGGTFATEPFAKENKSLFNAKVSGGSYGVKLDNADYSGVVAAGCVVSGTAAPYIVVRTLADTNATVYAAKTMESGEEWNTANPVYDAKQHVPYLKVVWGDDTLKAGADYDVELRKGAATTSTQFGYLPKVESGVVTEAGTYTYQITAKGSKYRTATDAAGNALPVYKSFALAAFDMGSGDEYAKSSKPGNGYVVELRDGSSDEWTDAGSFSMGKIETGAKPDVRVKLNDVVIQETLATSTAAATDQFAVKWGYNDGATHTGSTDPDFDQDYSANGYLWLTAKTATASFSPNFTGKLAVKFGLSAFNIKSARNATLKHATYAGGAGVEAVILRTAAEPKATDNPINAYVGTGTSTVWLTEDNCAITITKPDKTVADWNAANPTSSTMSNTPNKAVFNQAGTYTITFAARATALSGAATGLSGKYTVDVVVDPYTLTASNVLFNDGVTYNGSKTQPTVSNVQGIGADATLTEGVDFTATPSKIETSGKISVTVKGINNYTGTVTDEINVKVRSFTSIEMDATSYTAPASGTKTSYAYTGKAVKPKFVFKAGTNVVDVTDTDYTVKYYKMKADQTFDETTEVEPLNVGTYEAKVSGAGGYEGTGTATFTISGVDISTASKVTITLTDAAKYITYSGGAIDLNDYVDASKTTIVYADTSDAVALSTDDFEIYPKNLSKSSYKEAGKIGATGAGSFNEFTVYGTGNLSGNVAVDDSNVKIAGEVNVKAADLEEVATIESIAAATFNNKDQKPAVTVKDKAGNTLKLGDEFTVEYKQVKDGNGEECTDARTDKSSVKNAGTYEVTLTGVGGYAGSTLKYAEDYVVAPYDIGNLTGWVLPDVDTELSSTPLKYTGGEQEPKLDTYPTVKMGAADIPLTSSDITFGTVTAAGTYKNLVLKGQGNYTGEMATKYQATVGKLDLKEALDNDKIRIEYKNGGAWTPTYVGALTNGMNEPEIRVGYIDAAGNTNYLAPKTSTASGDYTYDFTRNKTVSADADAANTTAGQGMDTWAYVNLYAATGEGANVTADGIADGDPFTLAAMGADNVAKHKYFPFMITDKVLSDSDITVGFATGASWNTASEQPATYDATERRATPTVKLAGAASALAVGTDVDLYVTAASMQKDGEPEVAAIALSDLALTSEKNIFGGATAPNAGYFNFKNADSYEILAVGKTIAGTATYKLDVAKRDLSTAKEIANLSATTDGQALRTGVKYTGKAIKLADSGLALKFADETQAFDVSVANMDATYENNVDAGTARATYKVKDSFADKGNYTGEYTYEFAIGKQSLDRLYVVKSAEVVKNNGTQATQGYAFQSDLGYPFTGKQITPEVQVILNDDYKTANYVQNGWATILDSSKYEVFYGENTSRTGLSNTAVVNLTDADLLKNIEGTASMPVTINAVDFTTANIAVGAANRPYTGSAIDGFELAMGDYSLIKDLDYLVKYTTGNTEPGTVSAELVGINNFTSAKIESSFNIVAANITGLSLESARVTYNGKAQQPVVKVVSTDGYAPNAGEYAVAYLRGGRPTTDFTSVGDIVVRVAAASGNTHIAGSAEAVYTIQEAALVKVDAPKAATGLKFTGKTQTGVKAGAGYLLTGNTGKAAGSYTATAKLAAGYAWSDGSTDDKKISWTIAKAANKMKAATAKGAKKKTALKAKASRQTAFKGVATVKSAAGKVTVKNVSKNKLTKAYKVSYKSGKINLVVPKGEAQKGITRQVRIQVKAAGNANFASATKIVKLYVKGVK